MDDFEKLFIAEIRKKFQSQGGRMSMISLMMDEIKLDTMKTENRNVSNLETIELFRDEVEMVANYKLQNDIKEVMDMFKN
jgi:hypothetical protein